MTPQEALETIKVNRVLPKGITATLDRNSVIIGNNDVNFVLTGDLLLNEETVLLTFDKCIPGLWADLSRVFEERKAAEQLDAKLKADLRAKINPRGRTNRPK